jgi:hypothetical protein
LFLEAKLIFKIEADRIKHSREKWLEKRRQITHAEIFTAIMLKMSHAREACNSPRLEKGLKKCASSGPYTYRLLSTSYKLRLLLTRLPAAK